jgi:hypothetical protein
VRILVGVPVFRVLDLARQSINSLLGTPADVVVIDNAADEDIKRMLKEDFSYKVHIITNSTNGFCNGGWNQVMHHGLDRGYDIIGLGSSDAQLHSGWHNLLISRASSYDDEVWVPKVGEPISSPNAYDVEHATGGVAGFYMFLPRKAVEFVYPIPAHVKHWFGDQYIFDKLRANGWKVTIMNCMTAYHQQSAITAATPEAYHQIERDKAAWNPTVPNVSTPETFVTSRDFINGRWVNVTRKM